jgi:hypothetical protein
VLGFTPTLGQSGVATLFFLLPSTNTKHYFPLQEACETSVQYYMKIILEAKRKPLIIRICLLKRRRREVKKDPKLDGQWKDSKLGGQWKDPKLGGQWNVPSLVAIGRIQSLVANGMFQAWWPLEGERETPFHLFHFPPNNLYPNLQFFPLTLQFYFTMVLSRYSRLPFLFFDL